MNIHRYLRTAAVLLAAGGLGFGLVGAGVRASFSDSATATENIHVGTFGISVSSATPGAVVVNAGGVHTVTYTAADIQSSAAASAPLAFTVTSTGTIPATIHVVKGAAPAAPFSDLMLANPADVILGNGAHQDYAGGIAWTELFNANQSQSVTVTYTISAVG